MTKSDYDDYCEHRLESIKNAGEVSLIGDFRYLSKKSGIILVSFFVLLTILSVVCGLSYHLGADINWDLRNYHFYNGYTWTHGKFISGSLATIQSYLDPKLNAMYYYLISSYRPITVNIVLAALQSIGIFGIWCVNMFVFRETDIRSRIIISLIVACAAIFGPVFWSEIGGTMGDTLLAAPVIFSILLTLYGYTEERLYPFAVSGFLVGVVCGLKFTNMTFVVAILIAILVSTIYDGRFSLVKTVSTVLAFSVSCVFGFVVLYYNIGIVLWANYKNPVFPYFNNIFNSPDLASYAISDGRWFPKTIGGYFFLPFEFCVRHSEKFLATHHIGLEIPFRTFFFAAILVISPIAVAFCAKRGCSIFEKRVFLFLMTFFWSAFIIWELMFSYYRYAAVIEMLGPVILAFLLYVLMRGARNSRIVAYLPGVIVLCVSAGSFPHRTWGREPFKKSYFGVNSAEFARFDNAIVIVGSVPMGYILPYFPKDDKVIGIPERIGRLTSVFQERYLAPLKDSNKRIFYVGTKKTIERRSIYMRKDYNITIEKNNCRYYNTNFDRIAICPAKRLKTGRRRVYNE